MIVKLLTEHHLELLGLKGGCRGSAKSTHVKIPHCWKSHALAQFYYYIINFLHAVGNFACFVLSLAKCVSSLCARTPSYCPASQE